MELEKVLAKRVSNRKYNGKKVSDEDVEKLLEAANFAPIANGAYDGCRLSVIRDEKIIEKIIKEYQQVRRTDKNPLYGANLMILFSSNKDNTSKYEDCGCVFQNIALRATDLEIQSCYIRGAINSLGKDAAYIKDLGLDEGYFPVSGITLGYSDEKTEPKKHEIKVNYL